MIRLSGKTALVPGAARGIGPAFTKAYVPEGARQTLAGIDLARARTEARQIGESSTAPGVVDGAHWDGVDPFFAKYEQKAPGQTNKEVGAGVPDERLSTAEDLMGMAVFLASDAAKFIVAQT